MGGLTLDRAVDDLILEDLDSDWDIACEVGGRPYGRCPGDAPARWIIFSKCPMCSATARVLSCTSCKDFLMLTEDGVECRFCTEIVIPFRRIFDRIEPLGKA